MHRGQAVSQFDPFFGQSNVNRPPIVHRALVREIFVLHHLLDVIGDVRRADFRACFGTSPHRYLIGGRLDRVQAEIARGISLADAAYAAGFADQSHMTRHFKSRFGLTPGRYAALCASEVAVPSPIPAEVIGGEGNTPFGNDPLGSPWRHPANDRKRRSAADG